jgi:hypothetical protein
MVTMNDLTDEVQELVWALIDEQATDDQIRRLEVLLLHSVEARRIYTRCMQMHADLRYLFAGKQAPPLDEEATALPGAIGSGIEDGWPAERLAVGV